MAVRDLRSRIIFTYHLPLTCLLGTPTSPKEEILLTIPLLEEGGVPARAGW
jgi:hypothetical protein